MTITSGKVKTKRLKAVLYMKGYLIPVGITQVRIRNVGIHDIKICFHGDESGSYVEMKSQEQLPVIGVAGGITKLIYMADHKKGELELLMWG